MIAGEIHPAFRPRDVWKQGRHLPWSKPRISPKSPRIFRPAGREAPFTVVSNLRIDLLHLRKGPAQTLRFVQCCELARMRPRRVRAEDAASALLLRSVIPAGQWEIGGDGARKSLGQTESCATLDLQPRDRSVRQFRN